MSYISAFAILRQNHTCSEGCKSPGICLTEITPQAIETVFSGAHERFQYTKVYSNTYFRTYNVLLTLHVPYSIPKVSTRPCFGVSTASWEDTSRPSSPLCGTYPSRPLRAWRTARPQRWSTSGPYLWNEVIRKSLWPLSLKHLMSSLLLDVATVVTSVLYH